MAALCGGAALLWMLQHQKSAVCPRGHPHALLAGKEAHADTLTRSFVSLTSSPSRRLKVMKIEYVNKRPTYAKAVVSVVDHVECRCQDVPRLPTPRKKSSRKQHSHPLWNQTLSQGHQQVGAGGAVQASVFVRGKMWTLRAELYCCRAKVTARTTCTSGTS